MERPASASPPPTSETPAVVHRSVSLTAAQQSKSSGSDHVELQQKVTATGFLKSDQRCVMCGHSQYYTEVYSFPQTVEHNFAGLTFCRTHYGEADPKKRTHRVCRRPYKHNALREAWEFTTGGQNKPPSDSCVECRRRLECQRRQTPRVPVDKRSRQKRPPSGSPGGSPSRGRKPQATS